MAARRRLRRGKTTWKGGGEEDIIDAEGVVIYKLGRDADEQGIERKKGEAANPSSEQLSSLPERKSDCPPGELSKGERDLSLSMQSTL